MPRTAWIGLTLALGCLAATAAGASPEAPATATHSDQSLIDEPWLTLEAPTPSHDKPRPLARDGKSATKKAAGASLPGRTSAAWFRTTLSLAGVIGLILLLAWGYRRMAAGGRLGLTLRPRTAGVVEILSRTTLAPRQSLCLVRVGPKLVLLGCTPTTIRPLDVINDATLTAQLAGHAAQQRPDSHTAEFTRVLESEARGFQERTTAEEESPAPTDDRLNSIRDTLGDTIQRLRTKMAGV